MPRKELDPGAERARSDAQIQRGGLEQALAALERRITAIERLLAAIPFRPAFFPLGDVFLDIPGAGGAPAAAAEIVNLKHCEWQTLCDGETPQRVKITAGNGAPGKVRIEVDGRPVDPVRSPNTTFVEGKKIRVHFEKDEAPPGGPTPLLDFMGISVERGVGPGAMTGTIHLHQRPCEWHTVYSLSAKACIRVRNAGGVKPQQPLEVEVDGVRKDDLGPGNTGQYEGRTVRVHATGDNLAWVTIEPCR